MKKYISLLLVILMLVGSCLPAAALSRANPLTNEQQAALHEMMLNKRNSDTLQVIPADDGTGRTLAVSEPTKKRTGAAATTLENLVGVSVTQQLRNDIFNALMQTRTELDLTKYNLTYSKSLTQAITDMISSEFFEALHFDTIALVYYTDDYSVTGAKFTYDCTKYEFEQKLRATKAAAAALLSGIQGNDQLTDVQKALLLHDRLALHCDYGDVNADTKLTSNMYAALVLRTPVCQGYAEAYAYLLKCVGIKSDVVISDALDHAWNIAYINNKAYHIDVTWDDPSPDVSGRVLHKNFMLSTNELRYGDAPHSAYDYPDTPTDTTYDDYYWKNSEAAFVLLNNEVYYIDNKNEKLHRMSDGSTVCSVSNAWDLTADGTFLLNNAARLGVINNTLYVSMADTLYTVDPTIGNLVPQYRPTMTANGSQYYCVYGFYHTDGAFTFDLLRLHNGSYDYARTTEAYKLGTSFVFGDVDGSENVAAADARIVLRAAVGLESIPLEQKTAADLDFDTVVSSADARLVLRYAVGLESFTYDPTKPDVPDVPDVPDEPDIPDEPHVHNYVNYYCDECDTFQPGKFTAFMKAFILENYGYTSDDLYYFTLEYESQDDYNNIYTYYNSFVYDAQTDMVNLVYSSLTEGIFFSNLLYLPTAGASFTDGAFIVEDADTDEMLFYAEFICPNANFVRGINMKLTYTEGEQDDPAAISSLISDCTYLSVLLLYNFMQDLGYYATPTDLGFPLLLEK